MVGEIQQPLHAGFAEDHGGNSVDVRFNGRKENLHSLWDNGLGNEGLGPRLRPAVSLLRSSGGSGDYFGRNTGESNLIYASNSPSLAAGERNGKRVAGLQPSAHRSLGATDSHHEILRVTASAPKNIQPVLNAVAENAAQLCDAQDEQI